MGELSFLGSGAKSFVHRPANKSSLGLTPSQLKALRSTLSFRTLIEQSHMINLNLRANSEPLMSILELHKQFQLPMANSDSQSKLSDL